jgi:hypothetical protein
VLQKSADLRVRRHAASVPNGHMAPKCHGMQEVRGSNPLSSTSYNASTGFPLTAVCQRFARNSLAAIGRAL